MKAERTALFALALLMTTGCVTARSSAAHVEARFEDAFAAAERVLQRTHIDSSDRAAGKIVTRWLQGPCLLFIEPIPGRRYMARRRFEVRLWPEGAGTGIEVTALATRPGPGRTPVSRWQLGRAAPVVEKRLIEGIMQDLGTPGEERGER